MKDIHLPVRVHSCRIKADHIPLERLVQEERYVEIKKMKKVKDFGAPVKLGEDFIIEERDEVESVSYIRLPKSCRCRKYISNYRADQFVENGSAMRTFKLLARGVVKDENQIWMPIVRERVPRVDLISRADIERSVLGSTQKSKYHRYNSQTQRFELIGALLENKTLGALLMDAETEEQFERKIRNKYSEYIEECHNVTMQARAKLIVPFRPDPFDGRPLFFFSYDMRTAGGHS